MGRLSCQIHNRPRNGVLFDPVIDQVDESQHSTMVLLILVSSSATTHRISHATACGTEILEPDMHVYSLTPPRICLRLGSRHKPHGLLIVLKVFKGAGDLILSVVLKLHKLIEHIKI